MTEIATLTLNPTIDVAYEVDRVVPTHKMRARVERHDPGGGGINVARVLVRLGGQANAWYLAGGATGEALDGLLDRHRLGRVRIPITGDTRIATTTFERATGLEFRVVPPGPEIAEAEWQACLDALATCTSRWVVLSGSLPQGVPADFYARVARLLAPQGVRLVLDSSGEALRQGLAGGGFHLVKPSLGELEQIAGRPLSTDADISDAARAIVDQGRSDMVAVTLGEGGALLARREGVLRLPSVPVTAQSAVGAGDSFVAGMVHALAGGHDALEAFRHGIAAGAAAVMTPGTDLCRREDVERLLPLVAKT